MRYEAGTFEKHEILQAEKVLNKINFNFDNNFFCFQNRDNKYRKNNNNLDAMTRNFEVSSFNKTLKLLSNKNLGIVRMGHCYVPLDEALVLTAVDYSGRGYSVIDAPLTESDLGGLPSDLIRHFMETFSRDGGFNLHLKVLAGMNNHHIAEASFKSLARSMKDALSADPRQAGKVASTKGTIKD